MSKCSQTRLGFSRPLRAEDGGPSATSQSPASRGLLWLLHRAGLSCHSESPGDCGTSCLVSLLLPLPLRQSQPDSWWKPTRMRATRASPPPKGSWATQVPRRPPKPLWLPGVPAVTTRTRATLLPRAFAPAPCPDAFPLDHPRLPSSPSPPLPNSRWTCSSCVQSVRLYKQNMRRAGCEGVVGGVRVVTAAALHGAWNTGSVHRTDE